MVKTIIELKILWYLNNVEDFIDKEALEIIQLSSFNMNGELELPTREDKAKLYQEYWDNLTKRKEPE